jgi:hypothetical protein
MRCSSAVATYQWSGHCVSQLSQQPILLSFVLFSARSLNNKLPELGSLFHSNQFDVLCITETWLHSSTAVCALVNGGNYSIYRSDRTISQCGVGVYIVTNSSPSSVPSVRATVTIGPSKLLPSMSVLGEICCLRELKSSFFDVLYHSIHQSRSRSSSAPHSIHHRV